MRAGLSILILVMILGVGAWVLVKLSSRASANGQLRTSIINENAGGTAKLNFESDIKPIFEARCQPCHFQGGKVYDKLPFDKAETITRLGTKLFTRIKDEKEQQKIRAFLDQQ